MNDYTLTDADMQLLDSIKAKIRDRFTCPHSQAFLDLEQKVHHAAVDIFWLVRSPGNRVDGARKLGVEYNEAVRVR